MFDGRDHHVPAGRRGMPQGHPFDGQIVAFRPARCEHDLVAIDRQQPGQPSAGVFNRLVTRAAQRVVAGRVPVMLRQKR